MNDREAFWSGDGGNQYTQRNRVSWRSRVPFWRKVIERTNITSALEVGCNVGWNLRAMKEASPGMSVQGVDINQAAVDEAVAGGVNAMLGNIMNMDVSRPKAAPIDMVFTAGVLIHISQPELMEFMRRIVAVSDRYVLAVEYEADQEIEVNYRGQGGLLWRRNYGPLYYDMGLRCEDKFDAGDGFDRCTCWIMEKC